MFFKKTPERYLILDIGSQNTKAAVFHAKNSLIEQLIMRPTPEDAFQDGFISSEGSLSEFILQCAVELEAEKESEAVVGLSGKGVIAKKIDIPQMEAVMIPEFVEIEAEQELFYNRDEMELDYEILKDVNFNKPNTQPLLLITALKKVIQSYNQIVKKNSMNCKILDTNFSALFNSFEHNEKVDENSNYMLMDIGCSATNLIVVVKNQVVFVRNLPVAGNFFNQKIQQHLGMDYQEAEELKVSAGQGEEAPQALVNLITNQLNKTFVEEIQSCCELYYSLFPDQNINRIYVTGGASQTIGLTSLIEKELDFPVKVFDPFQNMRVGSQLKKDKENLKYFSSVITGLALRSLHD